MKRDLKDWSKKRVEEAESMATADFRGPGVSHTRNFKKLLEECSNLNSNLMRA